MCVSAVCLYFLSMLQKVDCRNQKRETSTIQSSYQGTDKKSKKEAIVDSDERTFEGLRSLAVVIRGSPTFMQIVRSPPNSPELSNQQLFFLWKHHRERGKSAEGPGQFDWQSWTRHGKYDDAGSCSTHQQLFLAKECFGGPNCFLDRRYM